ncbi:MAG: hypothetical protein ABIJ09_24235 [Pseudomonadota bacterium]
MGHWQEIDKQGSTSQALLGATQNLKLLRPGQEVLPFATRLPVHHSLEHGQKLRRVLDLVENQRWRIVLKEQLGIAPGITHVGDGIEHECCRTSAKQVREQCRLSRLTRASQHHDGKAPC